MSDSIKNLIHLDQDENYIVSKSINELGGPYHSRFSKHLREMHRDDYGKIESEIDKHSTLQKNDIPLVLETLYLLLYEMSDWDFGALYDGVTKNDVKKLYNKLEKLKK